MTLPLHYLEIIVVALGIVILMLEAFLPKQNKSYLGYIAAAGLLVVFVLLFFTGGSYTDGELARFYATDGYARFFKGLSLLVTMLIILMAVDYRQILSRFTDNPKDEDGTGEFYALPLFACAGMMWMASAKDLVSAFVSLELTTVTFYVLVAYMRRNVGSLEAGVKYLILGALSTGFLVYGIAWIYGITGSMNLEAITAFLATPEAETQSTALLFGVSLILVSLAFKVGAVPMHFWIPDVYQGAPTPTTTFLSVGSKAAGFIVALRILEPFLDSTVTSAKLTFILLLLASATLLVGNLAALPQNNFKRLLSYSSIANAGFLVLAIAAWTQGSDSTLATKEIVAFYLATYLLMTVSAFYILQSVSLKTGSDNISTFQGLAKTHPALAWTLTIILAALAGLPLTAGFFGKFFVFQAAIAAKFWLPIGIAFVGAAAGFYYYFKVIKTMFWNPSAHGPEIHLSSTAKYVVYPSAALLIILGLYPQPIFSLLGS